MKIQSERACRLSIVVPVYRSALILPRLIEQISAEMNQAGLAGNFELLLVNDASPDDSWQVILSLVKKYHFVRGISLRRNFGQHNATMAGLNCVRGEFVVIMDDDLQHPPQAINDMLRALGQNYDVCYTRYLNRQHVAWKKLGSQFNDLVATYLLNKPKGLYLSSFKAIRREVADEIVKYDGPYAYVDGLILDITRSITTIDVEHQARDEGEGNYNLRRSLSLWLKMATSFSIVPLRLATFLGFSVTALSAILIIFLIIEKILHPDLPAGWTSLIATILFIGGMQTLFIGLIGEYLGRAYLKLNRKPQYVIGSTTWSEANQNE